MREIAEGIYYEGAYRSGNVGCVQTREGAVLVDTPMLPNDAWDWLKKTAAGNREGIAFLINTDYHLQRVLGNCYFPAPSIAHQRTWIEMQRYDESYLQRYFGMAWDDPTLYHLHINANEVPVSMGAHLIAEATQWFARSLNG